MADSTEPRSNENRVAAYIDFDNIVISRYDQVHGRGAWRKDNVYRLGPGLTGASDEQREKIRAATVDISAILDYASSFGTIVVSRAYADWSVGVNASYQGQLTERAVDLTQLFPSTKQMKNGADIRLAVDVIEDLFRLTDLTHVLIAAGDSDYIPLAQRSKRLGRYVVGVGVAGGTSKSLAAACNEFADYDSMPGIRPAATIASAKNAPAAAAAVDGGTNEGADEGADTDSASAAAPSVDVAFMAPPVVKRRGRASAKAGPTIPGAIGDPVQDAATSLLLRALRLSHEKDDDADWLHNSEVKKQMVRLDPAFNEKVLGFRSFSDFVKSRGAIAELDEDSQSRRMRLSI